MLSRLQRINEALNKLFCLPLLNIVNRSKRFFVCNIDLKYHFAAY